MALEHNGQYIKLAIEEQGRLAVITIDNPPANALGRACMAELDSVIRAFEADEAAKVAIITGGSEAGAGMIFVAGADINDIANLSSASEAEAAVKQGQEVFSRIANMSKPIIAAINGACLGGGSELAMACPLRIASANASFGQPEIKLGIIPGFGGTQRLPRIVGKAKALEMMLTGSTINAQEALRLGLINKVAAEGTLLREARGLAKVIIMMGGKAVAAILDAVNQGMDTTLEEGFATERKLFGQIAETEDKREGLSAFIEKRRPNFKDK
ncbi:MAG: enoyl-CoA hydratase [Candidatus Chloroheliales bacterium]|nr:MAG: enoyl-CoA hydratase [Chloroflexota bacterium]